MGLTMPPKNRAELLKLMCEAHANCFWELPGRTPIPIDPVAIGAMEAAIRAIENVGVVLAPKNWVRGDEDSPYYEGPNPYRRTDDDT